MPPRHPDFRKPAPHTDSRHPTRQEIEKLADDVDRMRARIAQCWHDAAPLVAPKHPHIQAQAGRNGAH